MSKGMKFLLGCVVGLGALPAYAQQWRAPRMERTVSNVETTDTYADTTAPTGVKTKPPVIQARAQVIVPPAAQPTRHVRMVTRQEIVETPPVAEDDNDDAKQGACSSCGQCDSCCCCQCDPFWAHHNWLFGDYLYQKNYGPDMVHATQQNTPAGPAPAVGAVPFGRVGELTPRWQSAYRFGGELAFNDCTSVIVSYTEFLSHTTDSIGAPTAPGAGSVVSSVLLPGAADAGTTFSLVDANYDVDYKLGDIMFSRLVRGSDVAYLNFDIGLRYGHLRQDFLQDAEFAQPNNPQLTTTQINFDGAGMRFGFDGRRRLGCGGLSAYGQGFFTALFGRFHSDYTQLNTLTTDLQGTANWQSDRVVPMIDYEVGLSWTSCNGRWRLSSGYNASYWFNAISTPGFIEAVQATDYHKVSDTLTFTGFVSRLECQF